RPRRWGGLGEGAVVWKAGPGPAVGGGWRGLGAIGSRLGCGVNASGGSVAIALLAGVVARLAVVRSALSAHVASINLSPKRDSTRSHRLGAAEIDAWLMVSAATAAAPPHPR